MLIIFLLSCVWIPADSWTKPVPDAGDTAGSSDDNGADGAGIDGGHDDDSGDQDDDSGDGCTQDWYPDADADGWGDDHTAPIQDCAPPETYVTRAGDCDDSRNDINPDQIDPCDTPSVDEDCDQTVACRWVGTLSLDEDADLIIMGDAAGDGLGVDMCAIDDQSFYAGGSGHSAAAAGTGAVTRLDLASWDAVTPVVHAADLATASRVGEAAWQGAGISMMCGDFGVGGTAHDVLVGSYNGDDHAEDRGLVYLIPDGLTGSGVLSDPAVAVFEGPSFSRAGSSLHYSGHHDGAYTFVFRSTPDSGPQMVWILGADETAALVSTWSGPGPLAIQLEDTARESSFDDFQSETGWDSQGPWLLDMNGTPARRLAVGTSAEALAPDRWALHYAPADDQPNYCAPDDCDAIFISDSAANYDAGAQQVMAADLNGDGLVDLAWGLHGTDDTDAADAGAIYVFLGRPQ